ncbi:MAG: 3-phosphoglycerate dehydrogenase [Bacteroidales bacterium]|nr:3-phosphoglycerate dehydrogenase [Bacteroidales bacterium]
MKVLIATEKPFAAAAVKAMEETITTAGIEVVKLEKYTEKKQLLEAVAEVDGIIIRSDIVDAEVLEAAKNLKIVVRAGAGFDNIDLAAATAHNVVAMNTPGQNANAVAELVFGMLLFQCRNQFSGAAGTELKGKTLGLHAFGNVARNVARVAQGFGMDVYAYDPFLTKEQIEAGGVKAVASIPELYSTCQYVSLHCPATKETIGSINYELLKTMPKGACLINTARKEVVDEAGLMQLMEERQDFKYIADVKPSCADQFVEKYGTRVFFTPKKSGAQTAEANSNAGIAAAKQSVGFLKEGIDKFRVN